MISRRLILICAVVLVSTVGAQEARKAGDNPKAVLPSFRRIDSLKKAGELLAMKPADSETLTADLFDPFYPEVRRVRDKKPGTVEPAAVIPPELLLARAAELIRPQGTVVRGSDSYLQMEDGKFCKVGDPISVNVDGLDVQVTVSSIQRNSYTLRLNDKELRRDFK